MENKNQVNLKSTRQYIAVGIKNQCTLKSTRQYYLLNISTLYNLLLFSEQGKRFFTYLRGAQRFCNVNVGGTGRKIEALAKSSLGAFQSLIVTCLSEYHATLWMFGYIYTDHALYLSFWSVYYWLWNTIWKLYTWATCVWNNFCTILCTQLR